MPRKNTRALIVILLLFVLALLVVLPIDEGLLGIMPVLLELILDCAALSPDEATSSDCSCSAAAACPGGEAHPHRS